MNLENLTFKGGIHMHDFKELTCNSGINKGPEPKIVSIALHQHIGAPCESLVAVGDYVKVGQKIGDSSGMISSPVHSSVSGTVKSIEPIVTPNGNKTKAIIIESDGKNEIGYEPKNLTIDQVSPEEILKAVREGGIVGLGGAGFPTHAKLIPPTKVKMDEVIINAAECEPYLTSDQQMIEAYPEKVVSGLELAMKAMGAPNGYLGVENNKPNSIAALRKACEGKSNIQVAVLKTKYPQGDQKRIIQAVTGKIVPSGELPTVIGTQVVNASTAIAMHEMVLEGKPLFERLITVTGHCIKEPKNILVKVGTSFKDVLAACGGFTETPGKVIVGGPMMGEAQHSIDVPTVKAIGGLLVLTVEQSIQPQERICIKCGKCVDICPVYLLPLTISRYSIKGEYDLAAKYHIMDCIECGTCSYVCPAKRRLVEMIRHGKRQIRALQQKR